MIRYLSGSTNDADEPAIIKAGIGLMIQPGNGYHLRCSRYPAWAVDNGCLNPKTYVGDEAFLRYLDGLPREGCLFVVIPDVARRPNGELGGDPVATWARFRELAPWVKAMGFSPALAAQDGIELMANLQEQLEEAGTLFIAGSTYWKLHATDLCRVARNLGKPVHMGRVNSMKRLERARMMGCTSADGTLLRFLRRQVARGESPGASNFLRRIAWVEASQPLPGMVQFEEPERSNR